MAISANTVWEVRPTNGVDTNSGGFVPGQASPGTDWSQQPGAQYALTGLTSSAANAVILSASAAADMKDNIINVTGGTNATTGHYQIISVIVGVSITVDRNWCTGAVVSGTANIGGAKQTIGAMNTILTTTNQNATGQIVYVKAEATITIGAGITFSPNGGTTAQTANQLVGYTSSRTDQGKVTIQATSGSAFTMLTVSPSGLLIVRNFIIDGNSRTTITGLACNASYAQFEDVFVINCTSTGATFTNQQCTAVRMKITGCANAFNCEGGNGPNNFIDCVAYGNTGTGFTAAVGVFIGCISANNTGASSDGFGGTNGLGKNSRCCILINCSAYTNGRDGFRLGSTINCPVSIKNCIGYGNAGKDIQAATNVIPSGGVTVEYSAFVTTANLTLGQGCVTPSVDPFVAGGSNNFALNNTAGGGAAVRGLGFPGVLSVGGTGYVDMGALQHQDTPSTTTYVVNRNVTQYFVDEGNP
jgi:hypothetical protein